MESFNKTFLIIIFSSLISLGGCPSSQNKESSGSLQPSEESPELHMKRIHLKSIEDNVVMWELISPEAQGYTTKNYIQSHDLQIKLYKEGQKSTDVTSDFGLLITEKSGIKNPPSLPPVIKDIPLKQGDMYLEGHVVVISTDGTKLETDWLWFQQKDGLITSTAPVQITRADSITNGIGLEATSDLSKVTIFNQTLVIKSTEDAKVEP